jgi:hypothetical protein
MSFRKTNKFRGLNTVYFENNTKRTERACNGPVHACENYFGCVSN